MSRPMTVRPTAGSSTAHLSHISRSDHATLNGVEVRAGDDVTVDGFDDATFKFRAFVTNERAECSWVDVFGGAAGHRSVRSFQPDRVSAT